MSGPESHPEFINGKPFIIRGHHLSFFADLIRRDVTPSELAGGLIIGILSYSNDETAPRSPSSPYSTYTEDVLGLSLKQGEEFMEYSEALFETFLKLPDDYPAEIVEGIPDNICEGCAIGKHCKQVPSNKTINTGDDSYLNYFINGFHYLNLPKPTINLGEAHFLDADPQQVRRVVTTVGVVKKILKEGVTNFEYDKP